MRIQSISIPTGATPLDGPYHTLEDREPFRGVLLMHGNTTSFSIGAPGFVPPHLIEFDAEAW